LFNVSVGPYEIRIELDTLPALYAEYRQHAALFEEFDVQSKDGAYCFIGVSLSINWPQLIVAQRYSPSVSGFDPGILLVPETKTLFVGAGQRLLAYRLDPLLRLWEDTCDAGFWYWTQQDKFVLMAAELELAAWDSHGNKLWTTFVEPPWEYHVIGNRVHLDVMGRKSQFGLAEGPPRY